MYKHLSADEKMILSRVFRDLFKENTESDG